MHNFIFIRCNTNEIYFQMKKQITLILLVFSTTILFAQSFDDKSISELEQLKNQAVSIENYELAAQYKKAIELKNEIVTAVNQENYEKAARLKEELQNISKSTTSKSITNNTSESFVFNENIGEIGCIDNNFRKGNMYGAYARFHGTKAQQVHAADNLIYYGLDITYSKLIDENNIGNGKEVLEKHAEKFNNYFNKLISVKSLQRWMRKQSILKGSNVFNNYKKMDMNSFVTDKNYCLSFSDIKNIIKGYNLEEKEGIGMVLNIANFNENFNEKKYKEFISLYITFFDIKTRDVLYAVEATGISFAPSAFWYKRYAIGVNYALRQLFIDRIYLQGVTSPEQLKEKFRLDR